MTTFSPLILAILVGTAFHNLVGTPAIAKAGVAFSMRRLLRFGIILLGFQLTVSQIVEVGHRGFLIIAATLAATFAFTIWMGRLLGVERKLAQLVAAGTSICGASAVIAVNTVTNGDDEDVAYAVACVTIFGSVAMFAYPLLPALLLLDSHAYGLWTGASIHELSSTASRPENSARSQSCRASCCLRPLSSHSDGSQPAPADAIGPRQHRRSRQCHGSCSASSL